MIISEMFFRCFAALGDVSKARYLHETNEYAKEAAKTMVSPNMKLLSHQRVSKVVIESVKESVNESVSACREETGLTPTRCEPGWLSWRRTSSWLRAFIWNRTW